MEILVIVTLQWDKSYWSMSHSVTLTGRRVQLANLTTWIPFICITLICTAQESIIRLIIMRYSRHSKFWRKMLLMEGIWLLLHQQFINSRSSSFSDLWTVITHQPRNFFLLFRKEWDIVDYKLLLERSQLLEKEFLHKMGQLSRWWLKKLMKRFRLLQN